MAGLASTFGIGFAFRVADRGVRRATAATRKGLGGIASQLERLDKAASRNRFSSFLQGLQLHRLNQISGALERMGGAAPQLTNSLDSMAASMNKDLRKAFVGMKVGDKQFGRLRKEVSRAVVGMNLDMGTAIETAKQFQSFFGDDAVKKLGFKSLASAIRTMEVLGLDAGEFSATMSRLGKVSGMTERRARDLAGQVFLLGREFGVGDSMLKAFLGRSEKIQDQLVNLGLSTPDAMEKATQSITLLAGALVPVTKNADEAMDKAVGIFEAMAKSTASWMDAFAGVEGSTPDQLLHDLAISFDDVGQALATLRSDPATFVQTLAKRMGELRKSEGPAGAGFRRLQALATKFGIPMEAAGESLAKVGAQLAKTPDLLSNAGDKMEKAAKDAHRSGRTLDEVLNMMKEGFESRLRGILARKGIIREFMDRTRAAYRTVGQAAAKLADESGPLGALTRTMLKVNTFGVQGLFLGMGDLGARIGAVTGLFMDVAASSAPVVTALGSMGLRFSHLLFPIKALAAPLILVNTLLGGLPMKLLGFAKIPMLIGAGLVGLGFLSDSKKASGLFGGVVDYAKNKLPVDILRAMTGFDEKRFAKTFGTSTAKMLERGGAWGLITTALTTGLGKAWTFAVENFAKGVEMVERTGHWLLDHVERGLDFLEGQDYAALTARVWDFMARLFEAPPDAKDLAGRLGKTLSRIMDLAWKVISEVGGTIWDRLAKWWEELPGEGAFDKTMVLFRRHGEQIGKALIVGMLFSSTVRSLVIGGVGGLLRILGTTLGAAGAVAGAGLRGAGAVGGALAGGAGPAAGAAAGLWGWLSGPGLFGAAPAGYQRDAQGRWRGSGGRFAPAPGLGARYMAGMGGRAARGGVAGAAFAGLELAGKAALGEEIGGIDIGGAIGTAAGSALGGAIGGPLGMMIGGYAGKALGELTARLAGAETPEERQAKKMKEAVEREEYLSSLRFGGAATKAADELDKLRAGHQSFMVGLEAETQATIAAADSLGRLNDLEIERMRREDDALRQTAGGFARLWRSGKVLDESQRRVLTPTMEALAARGAITAEQLRRFHDEGRLDLTAKAAREVAASLRKQNEYLTDRKMLLARQLETELAEVKARQLEREIGLTRDRLRVEEEYLAFHHGGTVKRAMDATAKALGVIRALEGSEEYKRLVTIGRDKDIGAAGAGATALEAGRRSGEAWRGVVDKLSSLHADNWLKASLAEKGLTVRSMQTRLLDLSRGRGGPLTDVEETGFREMERAMRYGGRGAEVAERVKAADALRAAVANAALAESQFSEQRRLRSESETMAATATNMLTTALSQAGVDVSQLPEPLRKAIEEGLVPPVKDAGGHLVAGSQAFDDATKTAADRLREWEGQEQKLQQQLATFNLEAAKTSLVARQEEAAAIKRMSLERGLLEIGSEVQRLLQGMPDRKRAGEWATGFERISMVARAGFRVGGDLGQVYDWLRHLKMDVGVPGVAPGTTPAVPPGTTTHARGGMVERPTWLTDAWTGKTWGLMGEAGPEAIVPVGRGAEERRVPLPARGSDVAELASVLREELRKTREVIKASRPNVQVDVRGGRGRSPAPTVAAFGVA